MLNVFIYLMASGLLSEVSSLLYFGENGSKLIMNLICASMLFVFRPPTLHGVPRENKTLQMSLVENCNYQRNILVLDPESKPPELPSSTHNITEDLGMADGLKEVLDDAPRDATPEAPKDLHVETPKEAPLEAPKEAHTELLQEVPTEAPNEVLKEADTISNGQERKKPVVKIRVKQSSAASRADTDNQMVERSMGGRNEIDRAASSSVSVDAPQRNFGETVSVSNHNVEEVNSWHDRGSRMTASIGSAKFLSDGDELIKELQCTADSSVVYSPRPLDPSSSSIIQDNNVDADARRFVSLKTLSVARPDLHGESLARDISVLGKEKKKSKEKRRKREDHKGHHDDPEYLERKRLKKEKKRREKELAKLQSDEAKRSLVELSSKKEQPEKDTVTQPQPKAVEPSVSKVEIKKVDTKPEASEGTSGAPKFRIKIKNRVLSKS